jgi:hypothetical protein
MNTNNHAPQEEVDILARMVMKHLSIPHEFICITESDLPGWWGKVRLFDGRSSERNLWLDLDTVITGPLDGLVTPCSKLRIAKNWAQSGFGGCQSSVMYWEGDTGRVISDEFDPAIAHWPPINKPGEVLWGDQEWITELRDEGRIEVEYFNPCDVVSYKYHCRDRGLPIATKVAVFHGKPKPSEVKDKWVIEARK